MRGRDVWCIIFEQISYPMAWQAEVFYSGFCPAFPGVAQLVARVVWDHDAAGSNPVTRTSVRRTQFRSVSAVSVRAAKTARPLRPSSFPKRRSRGGSPFRFLRGFCVCYEHSDHLRRTQFRSVSAVSVRTGKAPYPQSPSSFPNGCAARRTFCRIRP